MSKISNLLVILCVLQLNSTLAEENSLKETQGIEEKCNHNYLSFANILEPLLPAVVNIYTIEYDKDSNNKGKKTLEVFALEHFGDFLEKFNIPFNFNEMYSNPSAIPLGSGFIIEPSGYIVTNEHVIQKADSLYIKLNDNKELKATIIGVDRKTDLALLKVTTDTPLPFVEFGDSNKSRVGDIVFAIGNPFGRLGGSVTSGIISSKGRDVDDYNSSITNFIQTDAAINTGNSGGPMFDVNGKVIGVNTAMFSPSGLSVGIGFAIPSNTVFSVIEELKKEYKPNKCKLGITVQEVNNEIKESLNLKELSGALVVSVKANSLGDRIGIKVADIILEINKELIQSPKMLQSKLNNLSTEDNIEILLIRNGYNIELSGNINLLNSQSRELSDILEKNNSLIRNNITFSNINSSIRNKFGIEDKAHGIIITDIVNEKNSNFKIGDLITNSYNNQIINSIEDLESLYEEAKNDKKQSILLLVERSKGAVFVPLQIQN